MIEDLIDFIEIHPIVAFEAIYEPMLTSFWSLISFAVQLYIIMQYKGQHPPLLPKMPFCMLYLPAKLVCILQNFLHRVYTNLSSSFLEWWLGCKTCIVYTGLNTFNNVQSEHCIKYIVFYLDDFWCMSTKFILKKVLWCIDLIMVKHRIYQTRGLQASHFTTKMSSNIIDNVNLIDKTFYIRKKHFDYLI